MADYNKSIETDMGQAYNYCKVYPNEKANPAKAGDAKPTDLRQKCYDGRVPKGGIFMKKCYVSILLVVSIIVNLIIVPVFASSVSYIKNGVKLDKPDKRQVEGYIRISGSTNNSRIKLMVSGADNQVWYDVKLNEGKFNEEIWFDKQGKYTIKIMVNEYDRKYSYGPGITVENTEELDRYLIPAKHIESSNEEIINTAREITRTCSSDLEKARAIYDWVKDNIRYDYDKLLRHENDQYDNKYGALNTINSGKGVCYDYAALAAALCRSLGLRAKVVEGDLNSGPLKGLHAWNEFYIAELESWINIDITLGDTTGRNYFNFENNGESHTAIEFK